MEDLCEICDCWTLDSLECDVCGRTVCDSCIDPDEPFVCVFCAEDE